MHIGKMLLTSLTNFCRHLDGFRKGLVNALFFVTLLALFMAAIRFLEPVKLPDAALLRIDLVGDVREGGAVEPPMMVSWMVDVGAEKSTRVSDVIDALDRAAKDERILGVVLRMNDMAHIGMAGIREIGAAIDRYRKESGRQVWTWSTSYDQPKFLLSAHADHVGVHPMGAVMLKGLSATTLYWGGLLRAVGVEVDVHKAGAFKSAPEVFTAERPSEESLAAQKSYMDDAWQGFASRLEIRRGLAPGASEALIRKLARLPDDAPSLGQIFADAGFIDKVETYDEFTKALAERYSEGDVRALKSILMDAYLAATDKDIDGPHVAVLVAEGEITRAHDADGMLPDDISAAISALEMDDQVRALVVRINSPGGDAVAAELIRDQIRRYKEKAKVPVIISMGDLAASGGYWIATVGDKIVADPLSITGSIGVFAMSVRAEGLREELRIGRGGYRTGPLADFGNSAAELGDVERRLIDAGVNRTYADFKKLVAESRHMDLNAVERVAQGRVWTGAQAVKYGLADAEGGLYEALVMARREAKLPVDAQVVYYEPSKASWRGFIREMLQSRVGVSVARVLRLESSLNALLEQSGRPLAWAPFEPNL